MKVIRVLCYDGTEEWLERQVGRSMPDGVNDSGRSGYPPEGGTITIRTVVDERPSQQQVMDPIVVQAVKEMQMAPKAMTFLEQIRAAIPTHPPTLDCHDPECMICGVRDCPHGEPLHYHHDGCPACYHDEETNQGDCKK